MSEFGDVLKWQDQVNSEIVQDAVGENDRRCTCKLKSSTYRGANGGYHWVSLEMNFEAEIECPRECT